MRDSRCAARHPHWSCAGTARYGSHPGERAPVSQTGPSCLGGCDASSHRGPTDTPHRSQTTGEEDAEWGGSGGRSPHPSDYVSESASENDASPRQGPQLDPEGSSGHRCGHGSIPVMGRHSCPACSGRGLLHHHRRNAGTCYG